MHNDGSSCRLMALNGSQSGRNLRLLFNDDLRLFQGVGDFAVQQLISETTVERLVVAVLSRRKS